MLVTYDGDTGGFLSIHDLALDQIVGVGGRLYGLDPHGLVLRIEPLSKRILWSRPAGRGSIIADAAGPIFLGAREIIAYRLDGTTLWKLGLDGWRPLRGEPRFIGRKIIIPWWSDGAWLTEGVYSVDRASGKVYGSYGPGRIVGFGDNDRAYAVEEYLGDADDRCCTATLDTVSLARAHPTGEPAEHALERSSRTIAPDERENAVRENPCDSLHVPFAISSEAEVFQIGNGFAFWSSGRLYDVSDVAIRRTRVDDECPIGESSTGAMLAAGPHDVDVVTRRNGSLVVLPVLHVERTAIVTSFSTPSRLYVEVGDWLYAIDPARARPLARWGVPCRQWSFIAHVGRADILACPARRNPENQRLYAFE